MFALMRAEDKSMERSHASVKATTIPDALPYKGPPTNHLVRQGDARRLEWINDQSVHLVVTSPPYFNLKKYNDGEHQLGDICDYEAFHDELDKVWRHCHRVLVPGGRLVCVVGDVCVARRKNKGRHLVWPLHADIAVRTRQIGFDYLTPILWHKISNAKFEANGNGAGFLGKPYEPNAIIKNDVEYILMLRKHGAYRQPSAQQRSSSRLSKEEQSTWFRPMWTGVTGASTKNHPAPYPEELAHRLVRMFSFTEDTVLDPFLGTGTTIVAAMKTNRNSIGCEIDKKYFNQAKNRILHEVKQLSLFSESPIVDCQSV